MRSLVLRHLLLSLLATVFHLPNAHAQLLELGVKMGVPMNDLVDARQDKTMPFTIGGMATLNLPLGFSIEGNALYKRLGFHVDSSSVIGGRVQDLHFNAWEFPLMLKSYPLGRNPLVQPFVSAGLNTRTTSGNFLGLGGQRETTSGLLLGAGLRNGPGRLKIAPEVRYTRWMSKPYVSPDDGSPRARLSANQLEAMLGITF